MKRRMPSGRPQNVGPLMTNHLRDLDIELELLKRKRSMIEQQQRLLSDSRQPYQQDYDQGYNHGGRNFSHLYDDDHHRGHNGGSQSQNYQSDSIWESNGHNQAHYSAPQPSNYEFSGNRNNDRARINKPMRRPAPWGKNGAGPLLNTPAASYQSAPRMSRDPPPPKRRDFKPSKVTKAHTQNMPLSTLQKLPPQSRKNLVKNTTALTVKARDPKSEIFNPDVKPSNQVVGRMEFCLGAILKDIRTTNDKTYASILANPNKLRTIKQAFRERIQSVMIGKKVENNQIVIDTYRKKFPANTDKEILDLCADEAIVHKNQKLVKPFLPEDDPEKFFKLNFHKLFVERLDSMFRKIAALQVEENKKSCEEIIKDLPDVNVVKEQESDSVEVSNTSATDLNGTTETEKNNPESVQPSEENKEIEKDTSITSETVEAKDTETSATDNVENVTTDDKAGENAEEKEKPVAKMDNVEKTKFYLNILDQLIERRLPFYFKQKKDKIIEVMNLDIVFKSTRASIILETNKKAEEMAKYPVKKAKYEPLFKSGDDTSDVKKDSPTDATPKKQLFHVKVLAKPSLPDTKTMKAFLETFNPKMIKKPRTVHNLLIIGLSTESDMDKLLAANGTTVGNKTLLVSKSSRIKPNKDNAKTEGDNTEESKENGEEAKTDSNMKSEESVEGSTDVKNGEAENDVMVVETDNVIDIAHDEETPDNSGEPKSEQPSEVVETNTNTTPKKALETISEDGGAANDQVEAVKNTVPAPGTPTRASARLATATPSSITTRRASKLVNQ